MTSLALVLVIISALGHSSWNYLAKASKHKVAFLWLMLISSGVIFSIPFWIRVRTHPIPANGWPYILATSIIHSLYFSFLGMAYKHGDLSTVYPIARGTAPALIPFVGILWLNELPSILGAIGIVLVVIGIQIIGLPGFSKSALRQFWSDLSRGPVGLAFLTGLTITFYTIVDRQGARRVDPFVYMYIQMVITALFLAPWMIAAKRKEIQYEWTVNRWRAGTVSLLCVGTYTLVLWVMTFPVKISYIAAGRECSILFSALFGILLLKEMRATQKIIGAIVIILGITCIGFAR